MFGPWKRAEEAEKRALAAEERAGQLEQQVRWMQGQVEESRKAQDLAMKIGWNISSQAAWGFVPFQDVPHVQYSRPTPADMPEHVDGFDDFLDRQRNEFKESEMDRFKRSRQ